MGLPKGQLFGIAETGLAFRAAGLVSIMLDTQRRDLMRAISSVITNKDDRGKPYEPFLRNPSLLVMMPLVVGERFGFNDNGVENPLQFYYPILLFRKSIQVLLSIFPRRVCSSYKTINTKYKSGRAR